MKRIQINRNQLLRAPSPQGRSSQVRLVYHLSSRGKQSHDRIPRSNRHISRTLDHPTHTRLQAPIGNNSHRDNRVAQLQLRLIHLQEILLNLVQSLPFNLQPSHKRSGNHAVNTHGNFSINLLLIKNFNPDHIFRLQPVALTLTRIFNGRSTYQSTRKNIQVSVHRINQQETTRQYQGSRSFAYSSERSSCSCSLCEFHCPTKSCEARSRDFRRPSITIVNSPLPITSASLGIVGKMFLKTC